MKITVEHFETKSREKDKGTAGTYEPIKTLEKLKAKIEEVVKFREGNQNVHKYIKRAAKELSSLAEIIKAEFLQEKALRTQAEEDLKNYREKEKNKKDLVSNKRV